MIEPGWREAFCRFIETGDAEGAFLEYLNSNPAAQRAVEAAFAEQTGALDELARSLRSELRPEGGTHEAFLLKPRLSWQSRRLTILSRYGAMALAFLSIVLGLFVASLSRSVTETEGRLVIAERERHELQMASQQEPVRHQAEIVRLQKELYSTREALERTALAEKALTAALGRTNALAQQLSELNLKLKETRAALQIVPQDDVLKHTESLIQKGDLDRAIALLSSVQPGHPDYSAAHDRLAGIYLDEKKDPARAIPEFQKVLDLPENRELVNKRFAVTFLNLGRAYYLQGTPEGYQKAIEQLLVARSNKRFFPQDMHDQATHDTLYFLALASHKLYHLRGDEGLLQETSARWKEYFDFFPASLQNDDEVKQARTGAERYYEEIKRKLKDGG
jgi:tetratricopeptide (TPR) repeat protein